MSARLGRHVGKDRAVVSGRVRRRRPTSAPRGLVVEAPHVDPVAELVGAWSAHVQKAVVEKVGPILAERDNRIVVLEAALAEARREVRNGDREEGRALRAAEKRVAELQAEVDAQDRHLAYLRSQLSNAQVQRVDLVVSEGVTPAAPPPVASEPSVPAQVDLQALLKPLFDQLAEALKPQPPGEVEVVYDERTGHVTGVRRKEPVPETKPIWPLPEPR